MVVPYHEVNKASQQKYEVPLYVNNLKISKKSTGYQQLLAKLVRFSSGDYTNLSYTSF